MTVSSKMPESLLDTDILSLYRRSHPRVTAHTAAYMRQYGQLVFSELTRYEVMRGLIAARATRQLVEFEQLCRLHRTVPFDEMAARKSAEIWAELRARGEPIGEVDTMIAGVALAHGLAVVSRNSAHFSRVSGLIVLDWTR